MNCAVATNTRCPAFELVRALSCDRTLEVGWGGLAAPSRRERGECFLSPAAKVVNPVRSTELASVATSWTRSVTLPPFDGPLG